MSTICVESGLKRNCGARARPTAGVGRRSGERAARPCVAMRGGRVQQLQVKLNAISAYRLRKPIGTYATERNARITHKNKRIDAWAFNIPPCSQPSIQRATFMMTSRKV
eukprot:3220255-Pleurochrysis_carterae.AAC.1